MTAPEPRDPTALTVIRCMRGIAFDDERTCRKPARWRDPPSVRLGFTWCDEHKHDNDVRLEDEDADE